MCRTSPPEPIPKNGKGQSPARVRGSAWPAATCNTLSRTWQEAKLAELLPEEHQCNCTRLLFIYSFKQPTAFNLLLKSFSPPDSPQRLQQIVLPPPFSRALCAVVFAWRNKSIWCPVWGNGVQSSVCSVLNSSHYSALCDGLHNETGIVIAYQLDA